MAIRLEAIVASRLEAIATRVDTIASRLEAIYYWEDPTTWIVSSLPRIPPLGRRTAELLRRKGPIVDSGVAKPMVLGFLRTCVLFTQKYIYIEMDRA